MLSMTGGSLGGMMSTVMGGLEPELTALVAIVAAGGLGDLGIRSQQGGVREAFILPAMGPLFVGTLDVDGNLLVLIRSGVRRLPVIETPESRHFFERAKEVAERLEVNLEPIHRGIPSDICQVPEGTPVLDGLGPVGAETRSPTEYAIRDSLIDRSALLALIIYSCTP